LRHSDRSGNRAHIADFSAAPGIALEIDRATGDIEPELDFAVGQAQGRVSGGAAGCVDDAGTARHVQDFFVGET